VKVDVQASSGMFLGGPQASHQYHESLEASVAQSFPGNMMINCMVQMGFHHDALFDGVTFSLDRRSNTHG
jgi:Raffinose synthase or seed imbibition protein Sip1